VSNPSAQTTVKIMAEHDMAGRKSQTYDRRKTSGRGLGDDCARFMSTAADDRRLTLLSRLLRNTSLYIRRLLFPNNITIVEG